MKSIGIYILVSFLSLFFILQIALLLVAVKPELFTSTNNISVTDTVSTVQKVQTDSLIAQNADSLAQQTKPDTSPIMQKVDSKHLLKLELENQQKKFDELIRQSADIAKISDSTKNANNIATVKLLEAMSADNASRIIQQMEIEEAKIILKNMKKRQAAKILSLLEPEKAIELMK